MFFAVGVIYGMGARTAAERLKVEVARIVRIMDSFFRKFSRLKQWLHEVKR
jgi:DNA polymerase I-like protein with 3'-5' exonuclease and polymerase domains